MSPDRMAARAQLIDWVRRYLDGAVGLVEASREIWRLGDDLGLDEELTVFFKAVDSETDDLPVGDTRQYWNAQALAAKDEQRADFEKRSEEQAREACGSLLWVLRALPAVGDGEFS